jgi:hypothetical protein
VIGGEDPSGERGAAAIDGIADHRGHAVHGLTAATAGHPHAKPSLGPLGLEHVSDEATHDINRSRITQQ